MLHCGEQVLSFLSLKGGRVGERDNNCLPINKFLGAFSLYSVSIE